MNKLLEASLEGAEAFVDSVTENELLKNIPIVGTAVKLMEGALSIRDRIFIAKIQKFIYEMEKIPAKELNRFIDALDTENFQSVGETAFLVLEKLNDLKKAEMLGFYFLCYLERKIASQMFKRIANAIDVAFIDDLEEFLTKDELIINSQDNYMKNLLASGVTQMQGGKQYGNLGDFFFSPSNVGEVIFERWKEKSS